MYTHNYAKFLFTAPTFAITQLPFNPDESMPGTFTIIFENPGTLNSPDVVVIDVNILLLPIPLRATARGAGSVPGKVILVLSLHWVHYQCNMHENGHCKKKTC